MASSWIDVGTGSSGRFQARAFVATDGTEAFGEGATDGLDLQNVVGVDVFVEADSGQTLSGAGTIQVYFYDSAVGWARAPDFDITIPAGAASFRRYYPLAGSPGKGIPIMCSRGRMGVGINGVTISSGGVTVYLVPVG